MMAQPHRPHKFEKGKKDWNLELGSVLCRELRWRYCCCFCVTYVRVARIRRDRPQTIVSTTSAWRLQHFASSTINWFILHLVHHYLITQAQLSDLIPVFQVADSSTREINQIFKGGRVWRI